MPITRQDIHTRISPLAQTFQGAWAKIGRRSGHPELPINSLPRLNRLLWGLHRQKLITIGARTSQGKTTLALQLAWDMADARHTVYFLSLEQTKEALAERLFCNVMQVDNYALLRGMVDSPGIQNAYDIFTRMIEESNLILTDCIGSTADELIEMVEKLSLRPSVVVVDYIQTIRKERKETRDAIDHYMRTFRELAIKHNFCAINVSQINRGAQGTTDPHPQLHHLKGSGVIEEHSDAVLLLHYPHKYDPEDESLKNVFEINLAKNRDGQTGVIKCMFLPQYYKFITLEGTNGQ